MTRLAATNTKLDERAIHVLTMATDASEVVCRDALSEFAGDLPVALTAMLAGVDAGAACAVLSSAGSVRAAVRTLTKSA